MIESSKKKVLDFLLEKKGPRFFILPSRSMVRDAYLQCVVIDEKPEHLALAIVTCALQ